MKIYKYFLLHNKKLKPWIKYWLYIKSKDKNYVLSDILDGTSFYLENSSNKNFNLFQINGNSMQDGTPTPSNQVPINSAGMGSINEVISNKNLCNGINQNYFINAYATRAGVASDNSGLLIKTDGISSYTISTKVLQARFRVGVSKTIPTTVSGITLYNGQAKDGTNNSITINSNGYDYLIVNATDLTNIQIEKGSSATSFVPHQEQNISIPCQQPMRSIGNVRDEFVKENGVWYERHYIASTVLDITEVLVNNSYTNVEYALIPKMKDDIQYDNYNYGTTIFPLFTNGKDMGALPTGGWDSYIQDGYVYNSATKLYYWMSFAKGTGQTAIRQQLDGMIYNYVLSTPTDLLCTQEQITALESIIRAYTYEPITNINSTDITPAFLKIQYYMEV